MTIAGTIWLPRTPRRRTLLRSRPPAVSIAESAPSTMKNGSTSKTDLTQFRQECDKVCHRAVSALLFQLCSFSLAVSGLALPGTIVKSGRRTPAFSVAVSSTAPIPLRYRLQRRPLRYRLQRRARRLFARSRRRWQEGRPRRLGQFDSITARGPRRSDGYRNVWTH